MASAHCTNGICLCFHEKKCEKAAIALHFYLPELFQSRSHIDKYILADIEMIPALLDLRNSKGPEVSQRTDLFERHESHAGAQNAQIAKTVPEPVERVVLHVQHVLVDSEVSQVAEIFEDRHGQLGQAVGAEVEVFETAFQASQGVLVNVVNLDES